MKRLLFLLMLLISILIYGKSFGSKPEVGKEFSLTGEGYRFMAGVGKEDQSGNMFGIEGTISEGGLLVGTFRIADLENATPEFRECIGDGNYGGVVEITAKVGSVSRASFFDFKIDKSSTCKRDTKKQATTQNGQRSQGAVGTFPPPLQALPTYTNSLGMEFVQIPAGSFTRKFSSKNYYGETEEKLSKMVISKPFYLGKYPVTQEQWYEVMGENPASTPGRKNPVDKISWAKAVEFIWRLNAREGAIKYRLPSEAEWEYAARGGTATKYFFMRDLSNWNALGYDTRKKLNEALDEYAWFNEGKRTDTTSKLQPVGGKKPNPYGLYDIYGNVWEWVLDRFPENKATDYPTDPEVKDYLAGYGSNLSINDLFPLALRITRGGSYDARSDDCNSEYRNILSSGQTQYTEGPGYGLRVLMTTDPNPAPIKSDTSIIAINKVSDQSSDWVLLSNQEILSLFKKNAFWDGTNFPPLFDSFFANPQWTLVNDLQSKKLVSSTPCHIIFSGNRKDNGQKFELIFPVIGARPNRGGSTMMWQWDREIPALPGIGDQYKALVWAIGKAKGR